FEEFLFRARPSAQRRKPPAWLLRPDRMILKNESASRECGPIPAGRHFRQPSSRPRSSPSFEIINGTDFYRSFAAFAHGRNPLAPFDGFVQIIALENVVPCKLFLRFGEGPIERHRYTILHPDRRCSGRRFQALDAEQNPF